MKLLTFFVACLCQLGGTEVRCEEETGSQNEGFVTHIQSVETRWTNVANVLENNSALEYEGINIESAVVLVTSTVFVVHSEICFMRKDFPLPWTVEAKLFTIHANTGGPATKGIVACQNDTQHFLLTVSQTARGKQTAT